MIGRIIVTGIFITCVVCVIIGIITAFSSPPVVHKTDAVNKFVKEYCATAQDRSFCQNVLKKTEGADLRNHVKTVIQATLDATNATVEIPNGIITRLNSNNNTDTRLKMSLEDCNYLLESSVGHLQDALSMVSLDPHQILQHDQDIQQWISSVIAYQEYCFDEVEEPELKSELKNGFDNARKLSKSAMAVVHQMKKVFEEMGIKSNNTDTQEANKHRRLLGIEEDEIPAWVSATDRRLLAWHEPGKVKPHAVVAQDGSGKYRTISEALAAYPNNHRGRYIVYVKAGIYKEIVEVEERHNNVFMYGDGPDKTIVQGDRSNYKNFSTLQSATFSVSGEWFLCKSMGLLNIAGPSERQAVALRTDADFGVYFNCRIEGYQNTLHIHHFRQFFRNCLISGTVDMIFGHGTAVIQNSDIVVRWYSGQSATIIAHGRVEFNQPTGIVLHNCRVVPDQKLYPVRFNVRTFLGRSWKPYSRAVVMESTLTDFVQPEGWHQWDIDDDYTKTGYFGEYGNRDLGANMDKRVQWKGFVKMSKEDALKFTVENFIQGLKWVPGRGVPRIDGLLN